MSSGAGGCIPRAHAIPGTGIWDDAIAAPIPALIGAQQVHNIALTVKERRVLDLQEKAELDGAMDRAWANLLANYQHLNAYER